MYNINFLLDPEVNVWIATSDDLNGLVLEATSIDELIYKVKLAFVELQTLNHGSLLDVTSLRFIIHCEL